MKARDMALLSAVVALGERLARDPSQDEPRCPHCDQPCVVEELRGRLASACCGADLPETTRARTSAGGLPRG